MVELTIRLVSQYFSVQFKPIFLIFNHVPLKTISRCSQIHLSHLLQLLPCVKLGLNSRDCLIAFKFKHALRLCENEFVMEATLTVPIQKCT